MLRRAKSIQAGSSRVEPGRAEPIPIEVGLAQVRPSWAGPGPPGRARWHQACNSMLRVHNWICVCGSANHVKSVSHPPKRTTWGIKSEPRCGEPRRAKLGRGPGQARPVRLRPAEPGRDQPSPTGLSRTAPRLPGPGRDQPSQGRAEPHCAMPAGPARPGRAEPGRDGQVEPRWLEPGQDE